MADTMHAIKIEGPKKLAVVEVPIPQPDGKRVVVKITKVGICGSDLHFWEGGDRKGLIMGHEFAGTIVDPGDRTDLKAGDRVTSIPINPCGQCPACKSGLTNCCAAQMKGGCPGVNSDGAFAQYLSLRSDLVRKLPDTMSDAEAAMIEPATVALHAVSLAEVKAGDKVLIVGTGIIGLLCAAFCRLMGASYVAFTEANDLRAEKALALGDFHEGFDAKDPEWVAKLTKASGGGFDKVLECSANPSGINSALMVTKPRGTFILVGVSFTPVPIATIVAALKELKLQGDMSYSIPEFDQALDLLARKVIETERFVDDTIGLDGVTDAFELLSSGTTADVKILIEP